MTFINYEDIAPAGADKWTARRPRGRLEVVTAHDLLTGVYEPDMLAQRVEKMLPPGETSLDHMEAMAVVLAKPEQQVGMIDAILTDENQLAVVADRSYRITNIHGTGEERESFDTIVFAASSDGRIQIRRHLWRPEQKGRIITEKHAHASKAVTLLDIGGIFSDDVFEEGDEGEAVTAYSSQYKGQFAGHEQDVPVRELRLRRTAQRVFTPGSKNRMSDTFIHAATMQPSVLTSTVVVATKGVKPAALVYKKVGESSPARIVPVDVVNDLQRIRRVLRS